MPRPVEELQEVALPPAGNPTALRVDPPGTVRTLSEHAPRITGETIAVAEWFMNEDRAR